MMGGDETSGGGGVLRSVRARLPGLLLEVVSVVFAVLVALAADEWRDNRELDQRAAAARTAVLAELRSNRGELERTRAAVDSTAAQLDAAAHDERGSAEALAGFRLDFPSFSDAAWRITQVTDAASRLDFAWLTRIARIYATQQLCNDQRDEILRTLGEIQGPDPRTAPAFGQLRSRIAILRQLDVQLEQAYDDILEGGGA